MNTSQKNQKKIPCAACGTSPVNHRATYITTVIDSLLESTMGVMFGWIKVPKEGRLANMVSAGFVGIFRLFRLARFDTNIEKAISGRSKLIWQEANERGIRMEQIVMFGKHLEQYRARIGGRSLYFQSIPIPYWLPQNGYNWLDDKFTLAKRLDAVGVPTPHVRHASSWSATKKAFNELSKPVIIKPRSGSRGRHTTTNINTLAELEAAYKLAKMISPSIVIEEHLYGSVYRATVIDNQLVGFFRADPPRVTGDGVHTITELIDLKNATHGERLSPISVGTDTLDFIARAGYELSSVLPEGKTLDLTAKTGRLYGGYTKEMLPEVHPKMHEIFKKAGKAVEASIVGFDLIMLDPTQDPDTQRWGVIECNSLPFIDLHYFALEGEPINLAKNIWDLWQKKFPAHT